MTVGKGTQCAKLVEDFHFCHLSGDGTRYRLAENTD